MTEVVRFEPVEVQPGELLQHGFLERPVLVLDKEHPQVFLGRGIQTGIDDLNVHRKMARLSWSSLTGKVVLHIGTSKGNKNYSTAISVNGEIPKWSHHPTIGGEMMVELQDGDVIALEGSGAPIPIRYKYQFVMTTSGSASNDAECEDVPAAASSAASVGPSPFKALGDETICPLCMDIQVQCHFFVPCGHSFCHGCITPSPATCSICRVPVQRQTPNLVLDNMIWKMIEIQASNPAPQGSTPSYYDEDDIQQYLQRSGKTLPTKMAVSQSQQVTSPSPRRARRQAPAALKTDDLSVQGTPSSVQRKRKRMGVDKTTGRILGAVQGNSVESAICVE